MRTPGNLVLVKHGKNGGSFDELIVSRSPVRRSQAAANLMALNRNQTKEEKKASAQKRVRARAIQACDTMNKCGIYEL